LGFVYDEAAGTSDHPVPPLEEIRAAASFHLDDVLFEQLVPAGAAEPIVAQWPYDLGMVAAVSAPDVIGARH